MNARSKDVGNHFSDIDAKSIGSLVSAAADIALIVGRDGCVKDVFGGQNSVMGIEMSDLVGQQVQSLATSNAEQALMDLVETADEMPREITLTHTDQDGGAIQIKYKVLSLGPNKEVIFLGQNQSPVTALEEQLQAAELNSQRQSARRKQDAAEFRALFSINQHPILIVSTSTGMVKDANNSALSMLDLDRAQLLGQRLEHIFEKPSQKAMRTLLDQAKDNETEATATVATSGQSVSVKSMQGVVGRDALIFHLTPKSDAAPIENLDQALFEMAKTSNDFVAIVDKTGKALWSNDKFLALTAQIADPAPNLQDYLNCDLRDLLKKTSELGRLSTATHIRSTAGTTTSVELFVVSLQDTHPDMFGVTLTPAANSEALPDTPEPWPSQKIGSVPLSALVREEVDVIEKSCIEAALKLTGNNRQATAKVLGISRQGLYDKLRRHDLLKD